MGGGRYFDVMINVYFIFLILILFPEFSHDDHIYLVSIEYYIHGCKHVFSPCVKIIDQLVEMSSVTPKKINNCFQIQRIATLVYQEICATMVDDSFFSP